MRKLLLLVFLLLFASPSFSQPVSLDEWEEGVELPHRRVEKGKHFKLSAKRTYRMDSYANIIHYKDVQADSEKAYQESKSPWLDIDNEYYEDHGTYREYTKLPNIVRVYQNKIGYEVQERKTGAVHKVELQDIGGVSPGASSGASWKVMGIDFTISVDSTRVGIWSAIKDSDGVKTIRWRVTTDPKGQMKFLENPLVIENDQVVTDALQTEKVVIDEKNFVWSETPLRPGILIDADFRSYGEGGGVLHYDDATWSTAHDAATAEDIDTTYKSFLGVTSTYDIYRLFFRVDLSSIGAGATVTDADLKARTSGTTGSSGDKRYSFLWSSWGTTFEVEDFDAFSGSEICQINAISTYTYYSCDMGSVNEALLDTTGYNNFVLINYLYDYLDSSPSGTNGREIYTPNDGTYPPILSVTYTLPAGRIMGGAIVVD